MNRWMDRWAERWKEGRKSKIGKGRMHRQKKERQIEGHKDS